MEYSWFLRDLHSCHEYAILSSLTDLIHLLDLLVINDFVRPSIHIVLAGALIDRLDLSLDGKLLFGLSEARVTLDPSREQVGIPMSPVLREGQFLAQTSGTPPHQIPRQADHYTLSISTRRV